MDRNRVSRPGPAWDAIAVVSALYVPMAVLAMGPYLLEEPTMLLSQLPEDGVRGFLEGALAGRTGPYQAHLAGMISHTLPGALLLVGGGSLAGDGGSRRSLSSCEGRTPFLRKSLSSCEGADR